jgi:hypothetical protein
MIEGPSQNRTTLQNKIFSSVLARLGPVQIPSEDEPLTWE